MRLTEVRIRNFKGIEEQTLKFQPGFNLLKGENGTGKTSILDAIAVGLGAFVGWMNPANAPQFTPYNVRKEYQRYGDGSATWYYYFPAEVAVTAEFLDENQTLTWTRSLDSAPNSGLPAIKLDSEEVVNLSKTLANDTAKTLPILRYHGIPQARVLNSGFVPDLLSSLQNLDVVEKWLNLNSVMYAANHSFLNVPTHGQEGRIIGYRNALGTLSDVGECLSWCNQMERVRLQKGKPIAEYEAVKRAAETFMEVMEPGKRYQVFYDNQLSELICAEDGGETLSISNLSSGYQSLLWLSFDIACHMAQLNAFMLDKIAETPGVVLIDELDLHLHPKWQWRVIDALRTTFPNVQFIAATHAPILFASANDVWLVDLDGEKPRYEWSRYGLDVNSSVMTYQGNYELPERVRKLTDAVSGAINRKAYPEAKRLLDELEAELTPKPGQNGADGGPVETPTLARLRARYDIETSWPGV